MAKNSCLAEVTFKVNKSASKVAIELDYFPTFMITNSRIYLLFNFQFKML